MRRLLPPARLLVAFVSVACAAAAAAHDGPPYPILVDQQVAGVTVSIWADPDVGEGTFYCYVEGPTDGVTIDVESVALEDGPAGAADGTRALAGETLRASATPAPDRASYQLVAQLPFSHRGAWQTRFVVARGDDSGDLAYRLDVTPPGIGLVYLVWYAVPFLALAAIWLRVLIARRAHDRALPSSPESA